MSTDQDWIPHPQTGGKESGPAPLLHTKPRRGPAPGKRTRSTGSADIPVPAEELEDFGPPAPRTAGDHHRGRPAPHRRRGPDRNGPGPRPGRFPYRNLPNRHEVSDADRLAEQAERLASAGDPLVFDDLKKLPLKEINRLGEDLQADFSNLQKDDQEGRVQAVLQVALKAQRPLHEEGLLQVQEEGFGFLVKEQNNWSHVEGDTFIPYSVIKKYGLRQGQKVLAQIHPGQPGQTVPYALRVLEVMARDLSKAEALPEFGSLPVKVPDEAIFFTTPPAATKAKKTAKKKVASGVDPVLEFVDRLAPLAKGQRYLVSAPSRSGKSYLFRQFAEKLPGLCPKSTVMVLLLDARPEEIVTFEQIKGIQVVATNYEEKPARHVHAAETILDLAKRKVEGGEDVILLVDSLNKLQRAYQAKFAFDPAWENDPLAASVLATKRFWGAGRAIAKGGSLTMIASLVTGNEAGNRAFQAEVYEEMANALLFFERDLARRRIYPAINCHASGTNEEEKLFTKSHLEDIFQLRNRIGDVPLEEAVELVYAAIAK